MNEELIKQPSDELTIERVIDRRSRSQAGLLPVWWTPG
jgi:hypothetical protein